MLVSVIRVLLRLRSMRKRQKRQRGRVTEKPPLCIALLSSPWLSSCKAGRAGFYLGVKPSTNERDDDFRVLAS